MSLFGVQLNHQVNRIITEMRLTLQKNKFVPNVRTLYRSFAQFDPEVSGNISTHHFEKALNQNGLFVKNVERTVLEKAFGNGQGSVNWFHFLQTLKLGINEKRRSQVRRIYQTIAKDHQKLTSQILLQHFNPSQIDLVKSGKMTKEKACQQLISLLCLPQDHLTQQQFVSFYDDLSLNFPHDEPFLKYVCQQWGFSPELEPQTNEETLRSIIKAFRYKLIQKSRGTNDQFLLRKLFNQFDQNRNGYICSQELDLMLKKLELPVQPQHIWPLLKKLDRNNSGMIEYDQFKHFLFFDPFPA